MATETNRVQIGEVEREDGKVFLFGCFVFVWVSLYCLKKLEGHDVFHETV